jgi:uncharacterized membrane-anchored protein
LVVVCLAIASSSAWAGTAEAEAEAVEAEVPEAERPQVGPKQIDLGDELVLDLPALYGYFDRVQGKKLMERMGNQVDDSFRGLVFKKEAGWLIEIEYVGDGYVKDDDAAELKPDEILASIKEGTEEANEYRKEKGFPGIHVEGWTEPPRYERAQHHLVWGIRGKLDDGKPASINFYTRVLGRRGYVAVNLMDDPATIETSKADGLTVLRATTFKPGARYEDFDSKSDKVAEYGLAALVATGAGVTALKLAKVGILAKFSGKLLALILAGKKVLVLLIVGIGAAIKKLFGAKQAAPAAAAAEPPPADGPPAP